MIFTYYVNGKKVEVTLEEYLKLSTKEFQDLVQSRAKED